MGKGRLCQLLAPIQIRLQNEKKDGAVMELFTAKSSTYDYAEARRRTVDTGMWRNPYMSYICMFVCSSRGMRV